MKKEEMTNNNIDLGENLRKAIKAKFPGRDYMSAFAAQLQLLPEGKGQKRIPYTRNTISNIVNGHTRLLPKNAEAFSRILGVSKEYLLGETKNPYLHGVDVINERKEKEAAQSANAKISNNYDFIDHCLSCITMFGYDFAINLSSGFVAYKDKSQDRYCITKPYTQIEPEFTPVPVEYNAIVNAIIVEPHILVQDDLPDSIKIESISIFSLKNQSSKYFDLHLKDFYRFCHDIQDTLIGRFEFWNKYNDLDLKEELDYSYGFMVNAEGQYI